MSIQAFITKHTAKSADVTLVQIGDSVSTDGSYANWISNSQYFPPFIREYNLNYYLEENLRWTGQEYRRYDAKTVIGGAVAVFTETLEGGVASSVTDDDLWGYLTVNNFHAPYTRLITGGTNAGVSYTYPAGMKRCNFIYHTDSAFAASTLVTISEGSGLIQAWNGSAWVEANGYTFSALESSTKLGVAPNDYYRDSEQKRLKMRSLSNLGAKTVTITNVGAGRFGYWGIEYSPSEFMFTYICAAKGGHGITMLKNFQEWMVDDFNPDLVLWQCPIINQGVTINPPTLTPTNFAAPFGTHLDYLATTKGYLVLAYTAFVGAGAGMVATDTGAWQVGTLGGYGDIAVTDYTNALEALMVSKSANFVNGFNDFLSIAERKAMLEATDNIYTSAIVGSEKSGNTFTRDNTHFNDYGNKILYKILEEQFR